jgi:acyl carrier protein
LKARSTASSSRREDAPRPGRAARSHHAAARRIDPASFESDLVRFINASVLPPDRPPVGPDTRLFEDGLINSIKILDLIAFVEKALGARIPEKLMIMKHFRSPRAITDTFAPVEPGGRAAGPASGRR